MSFKVEKINSANAKVSATITNSAIEAKVDVIAKKASKEMKIDGFRKGSVPVAMVRSRYYDKLRQDAEGDLLKELIDNTLQELAIDATSLLGDPSFTKYDVSDAKDLEVEIKLSIKPEVSVEDYKSAIPAVVQQSVSDEEITARLEELATARAPMVKVTEDRALIDGDTAMIDFEGFLNGVAFDGGKAENYSLKIGSGSFIPGFEEQLIGMKVGEEKTIDVKFPENYQSPNLKGQDTQFKIKLNEIQEKGKVELNDDLAKLMNPNDDSATIASLKEKIKEQLEAEKQAKYYNDELKSVLVANLTAKFNFDLPDTIVEQEMNLLANNKINQMSKEEIEDLKANREKVQDIIESFREEASNSVKLTFIIDAIAKIENVTTSDNEVMQTLYYEALMSGQNPQQVMEYYKSNNLLPAVKMSMIEHKLIHQLLDSKLKG